MVEQDNTERREYNAMLHDLVAQHNESITRMEESINALLNSLQAQEAKNSTCRQQLIDMIPNGDHDGHRRWHEAEIKRMEARAAMWQDVQKSVAKWGILGIISWMSYAAWHEVLSIITRVK